MTFGVRNSRNIDRNVVLDALMPRLLIGAISANRKRNKTNCTGR